MRQIQQRFSDVRIYNVGASDHNGEVTGIQHPTRPVVAMGNVKRKWGDASSFPVMTCDAIVADAKLPAPHIYKIDTDTHDRKALAGSSETLSKTDLVIIEVRLYRPNDQLLSPHEVSCFMHERGFVLFDIIGIVHSHKDLLRVMDMIYGREDSELFRLATANSQKKTHAQLEREREARIQRTLKFARQHEREQLKV